MDWERAIEWNRAALTRVLAMLIATAGLAGGEPGGTLPRHLHRAVLRLLRPAEAAARRLVITAARVMVVEVTARRARPNRMAVRHGAAIAIPGTVFAPRPGFSLFDPLPRGRLYRPRQTSVPRISMPGFTQPFPIPPPPSPDDPVDATRLGLRLAALGRVLDDLPRQAKRFARWQARLRQGREERRAVHSRLRGGASVAAKRRWTRIWPLRPGRPPGGDRRSRHEVHTILKNTHGLALWALQRSDTS